MLSKSIQFPFTVESVIQVLEYGVNPDESPFTHQQIAEWCDRFWCSHLDTDPPEEISRLLPILTEIETQWDLFLINTNYVSNRMPNQWFVEWLKLAKG